jgi:surfeit locus 1 family protein
MEAVSWFARRRFRPTLWPTLGAILLVAATVTLGNWQRHRAEEKGALEAQYQAMHALGPVPLASLLPEVEASPAAIRYQEVVATGEYDARHQIYVDNRVRDGRAGYEIVTPLRIAGSDSLILVNRGWMPAPPRRDGLPPVSVPAGSQRITGRLNLPPARYLELAKPATPGPLWENLDIARIAGQYGIRLVPAVLELESPDAPGLRHDWPQPQFGREQHVSYMVQWYSLAALTVVLYLTLNWRTHDRDAPQ